MNWNITVIVDFESGNNLQIGDDIAYNMRGKCYEGIIDSFFVFGGEIRIKVKRYSVYISSNIIIDEILPNDVCMKDGILIK